MLQEKEEYKVPNLFRYLGYTIFFWANENFTKSGDCILENNNSRIPKHDLNKLFKAIQYNYFYIISEWKNFYGVDNIKFYC